MGLTKKQRQEIRGYSDEPVSVVLKDVTKDYLIVRKNPDELCDFFQYTIFAKGEKYKTIRVKDCWDENMAQNLMLTYEVDKQNENIK